MVRKRGMPVDQTTVFRWVQKYAPEINKGILSACKDEWHVLSC